METIKEETEIGKISKVIRLIKNRFNFALASGTITVLGVMVGLYSGTYMKSVVIGGIITIAIADAFSDALGFYISRETEEFQSKKIVWISTISSFLFKFFFILTFVIPTILFSLKTAIIISLVWGFFVIGMISQQLPLKIKKSHLVIEHLLIALIVVILTYCAGRWVSSMLGTF